MKGLPQKHYIGRCVVMPANLTSALGKLLALKHGKITSIRGRGYIVNYEYHFRPEQLTLCRPPAEYRRVT